MRISDWSSDVCSSDLLPCSGGEGTWMASAATLGLAGIRRFVMLVAKTHSKKSLTCAALAAKPLEGICPRSVQEQTRADGGRSDERRVRKGCVSQCRSRWSP